MNVVFYNRSVIFLLYKRFFSTTTYAAILIPEHFSGKRYKFQATLYRLLQNIVLRQGDGFVVNGGKRVCLLPLLRIRQN
jgi:hypothetical protein